MKTTKTWGEYKALNENLLLYIDSLAAGKWRNMDPMALRQVVRQYFDLLGRDDQNRTSDPHYLNVALQLQDLIPQWRADPKLRVLQNDLDMLDALVQHDVQQLNAMPQH